MFYTSNLLNPFIIKKRKKKKKDQARHHRDWFATHLLSPLFLFINPMLRDHLLLI